MGEGEWVKRVGKGVPSQRQRGREWVKNCGRKDWEWEQGATFGMYK